MQFKISLAAVLISSLVATSTWSADAENAPEKSRAQVKEEARAAAKQGQVSGSLPVDVGAPPPKTKSPKSKAQHKKTPKTKTQAPASEGSQGPTN